MALSRRGLILGTAPALLASRMPAWADDYPSKPIRLIHGFVAGGGADLVARVTAEALQARLNQAVVVETKPGAASSIALDYVAKSAPDGYTLANVTADGLSMLSSVKPHLQYDVTKDFTYIAQSVTLDFELVMSTKRPFKTLAELVDYAKANPGKIQYASNGPGSSNHLAALLLEQQAGISMTHVPYKGGQDVLVAVLAGTVDLGFLTLANIKEYTNSDKIRVLAVTATEREPTLPNVPTMPEAGYPHALVYDWQGLAGPRNLPPNVVAKLTQAMTSAMADTAVQQRLLAIGFRPAPLAGDAFRKMILDDTQQWKTVADAAHLVMN